MSGLFSYKGKRIQLYYRYLNFWYTFFFSIPTLVLAAWLCWKNWSKIVSVIGGNQMYLSQLILLGILVSGLLFLTIAVSLFAMKCSKENGGYFSRLQRCQWLLKYLIENNLVDIKKKKTETGSKELIQLPKVYYQKKKSLDCFTFELGGKNHKEFLMMGSVLEELFLGDLVEIDRKPMLVTYKLLLDTIERRLSIREVKAQNGSIEIMEGVSWEYDKMPNMLISGGIGGGKSATRSWLKRSRTMSIII